jgi:hypothetical protein
LITSRVIDEFGIRQRHLQRGQHRTGDGGSGNRGSALRNRPVATPARMSRSRRGATPPSDNM